MVSESTPNAPDGMPTRLLIVDDDAGIRTLLEVSVSLDQRFVLAGTAASGAECLRQLELEDCCDVVLLDVTLPDANGIDLLQQIREELPGVRIALFTGWSDRETIDRAREAGADAIFAKDGDPRRLLDGLAALSGA